MERSPLKMKELPPGEGALVIRTDFSDRQAWDDLCELIRECALEGLLTDVQLVDDPSYEDVTPQQLLAQVPDDAEYAYLAVMDACTTASSERPQDRSLLIIDLDDEVPGSTFRAVVSELAAIDANLSSANMDFSEYANAVHQDGVYRGFNSPE